MAKRQPDFCKETATSLPDCTSITVSVDMGTFAISESL